MNNTRLLTISKKNLTEIAGAIKALNSLLEKADRFKSALALHESASGALRVLHSAYAARPGRLVKGARLVPYTLRDLREARGAVVMLAALVIENKARLDAPALKWKSQVLDVFDLAIARVEWLEG